jgi:hypothetical protein
VDTDRPYPEGIAFDEAWRQRQRADAMEASRDAWRVACRHLYAVISEGRKRGRPMDLIGKADYRRIVELIADADSREPERNTSSRA